MDFKILYPKNHGILNSHISFLLNKMLTYPFNPRISQEKFLANQTCDRFQFQIQFIQYQLFRQIPFLPKKTLICSHSLTFKIMEKIIIDISRCFGPTMTIIYTNKGSIWTRIMKAQRT